MSKLQIVYCLSIFFCNFIFNARSIPCRGTASYKLQFQGEWTNSSSKPRPVGAKFSGLIGCSHNKCYRMWRPGEKASRGVKNVAERGDTDVLRDEINNLMRNRTTTGAFVPQTALKPQGVSETRTTHASTINVDSVHPLVSVISKITPSPDWFIGVHDLDLCDRTTGKWLQVAQVKPVHPYDAGTKSGSHFTSGGSPTSRDIARISGGALAPWTKQEREMGTFYFSKTSPPVRGSNGQFESDENFKCPNLASRRHISYVVMILAALLVLFNFHM